MKKIISLFFIVSLLASGLFSFAEGYDPLTMYRSGSEHERLGHDEKEVNDEEEGVDDDKEEEIDWASVDYNKPHAEVVSVTGAPKVMLSGETSYVLAEEGMYLEAKDKVKTGLSSSISLSFDDNDKNIIAIQGDSYIELILLNSEKLSLLEGRVFATIDESSSDKRFEIRTPTAIVGVRGTEWLTTVDDEGTDVESISGTSYVKHMLEDGSFSETSIKVFGGFKVRVLKYIRPATPAKISIQKQNKWRKVGKNVRQKAKDNRQIRRKIPGNKRRHDIKKKLHKASNKNKQNKLFKTKDKKAVNQNKDQPKDLKKKPIQQNKKPIAPKINKKPIHKPPAGGTPLPKPR